jgi:hypothetical protein
VVLAVGQVVARAAVAVAQRAQRPRHCGRADAPAVPAQQVGQIGQRPGRHRVAVVQRGGGQRPLQQGSGRRIEGRGRPDRGRSASPSRPSAKKRRRQTRIRLVQHPLSSATSSTRRPWASSSNASARCRTRGSGSVRVTCRSVSTYSVRSSIAGSSGEERRIPQPMTFVNPLRASCESCDAGACWGMARRPSADVRERLAAAVDAGLPPGEAATRFRVSVRSVYRWLATARAIRSRTSRVPGGRRSWGRTATRCCAPTWKPTPTPRFPSTPRASRRLPACA